MTIDYGKHTKVICTLKVGDIVYTDNWGYKLDGEEHIVEDIKAAIGRCDSGFLVKISGYPRFIDSNWLNKK